MSSLFGTMSISLRALLADQAALETTSNNIANVNTPGYSRRRAVLEEEAPVFDGTRMVQRGVTLTKIESLRDRVLELRTYDEVQQQQAQQAVADNLQGVQLLFGEGTGMIGDSLDKFFTSISQLSTDPSDSAERQAVLTAGGNLAASVNNTSQQLYSMQHSLDRSVVQTVSNVNGLTAQIADLNLQISSGQKLGRDTGSLEDQRGQSIRELSALVDVSTIDDSEGLTLTTSNGSPLVVGGRAYTLDSSLNSLGLTTICSQGTDITSTLKSGKLGGLLETRDTHIEGLIGDLDQFAYSLTDAMNTAHRTGTDSKGNPGGDLFVAQSQVAGSAGKMALAFSDPSLLAASTDGSSGGNQNLADLLAVSTTPLSGGLAPSAFYSSVVFKVGSLISDAQSKSDAGDMIVQQLDNQRGAISGVNMDEEAANLIRYQRAFQAAARVIDVVNQLTDTAVHLGQST